MFSLYLQNVPWNIVQNQHCIQLVFANCLKPAPNCTASSLCMSSWEHTWEYISLMGIHLEWVWGIQLEHTWTCGIHLEHIWNTLGTRLEYTWNTLGIHLEHTFLETFLVFLDLGLRWPGWTGNTVGIQVWITGRISGFEEHTWDISFWENGCLSISEGHTHRTWAGKEPFWNTLRSTFWAYKQHTFGTQKNHVGHFQCMAAEGGCKTIVYGTYNELEL